MGIAISSTWSVYQHLARGELVQVLAPKVRAFIDFYAGYFGDRPYWDQDLLDSP